MSASAVKHPGMVRPTVTVDFNGFEYQLPLFDQRAVDAHGDDPTLSCILCEGDAFRLEWSSASDVLVFICDTCEGISGCIRPAVVERTT